MNKDSKIFVAGHNGLIGSALVRRLRQDGFNNLVLRSHAELDLRHEAGVANFFEKEKPEYVFLAAAKVGGILANVTYPANFIYDNLAIQTNVIHHSYLSGVKRLLFLGSSCIYPKDCPQPMKEEYFMTGALESTNEAYAIAKIAGIRMCQAYNKQYGMKLIAAMPTNIYGPNDNFDLETSHVIPALIRKFHEAKVHQSPSVTVWGTGQPRREFLHCDDLVDACLFIMTLSEISCKSLVQNKLHPPLINIGCGEDLTIKELAELIQEATEFRGDIIWDTTKPDGVQQKLLDVSRLFQKKWQPKIPLKEGLRKTYEWFVKHHENFRRSV